MMSRKILVFRLSSFGDLILATAFLSNLPESVQVDWVTSKEFEWVLKDHPRVHKLYSFDKKQGLVGWIKLVWKLAHEPYEAWVDLHVTLRTIVVRVIAFLKGISYLKISKQRLQHFAMLLFKTKTPQEWRPTPYWVRFAQLGSLWRKQRSVSLRPPEYALKNPMSDEQWLDWLIQHQISKAQYAVVMPASRWKSKEWGVDSFLTALQLSYPKWTWIVLGQAKDRASLDLVRQGRQQGLKIISLIEEKNTPLLVRILQDAQFLLSNDTGFVHLAEALGTPAVTLFGPTHPGLGFGPWRAESRAVTAPVFCTPCSKDGKRCFRFWEPYACWKSIRAQEVAKIITDSYHADSPQGKTR